MSDLLKTLKAPFAVGLLVIVASLAGFYMVTQVDESGGVAEQQAYYATFDDVTGLFEKSLVRMSGIVVGTVTKVTLEPGGTVRVDFTVRNDIELFRGVEGADPDAKKDKNKPYFKNGATASKKSASLIGDYFLEITPGTSGDKLANGDEVMNVIEPISIDQLTERMDAIAKNVEEVTQSLAAVFGGTQGQENLQRLLDDLNEILSGVNQFVGENSGKLDRILSNAEQISTDVRVLTDTGSESVQVILRDTEAIVQEVRYIIGQSSGDLQSGLGTLKGTLSRLQSTLDSLNYSLQNIQDITDKVNEGEGTLGELVNNPAIAQRTEQILDDAGEFIGRVSRLRTIIDLRSEYHLNNEQLKNVLGVRLQPSDDKYYLIELIDDYRGAQTVTQRTINSSNANDRPLYNETEVKTTDSFKFSVELARTFYLTPWFGITGRFGLIESSGGIGINLILLESRNLEINADLFDFGEDVNPRLRTFANWHFFSVVYLTAGIDDSLNPQGREYTFGAGIRFDDDDLKAILTTTGVPGP